MSPEAPKTEIFLAKDPECLDQRRYSLTSYRRHAVANVIYSR